MKFYWIFIFMVLGWVLENVVKNNNNKKEEFRFIIGFDWFGGFN